jgi:hypothetical protein
MVDVPGIYWVFFSVNLHIIGFMFGFPSKSPENIWYNVRKENVNHLKNYKKKVVRNHQHCLWVVCNIALLTLPWVIGGSYVFKWRNMENHGLWWKESLCDNSVPICGLSIYKCWTNPSIHGIIPFKNEVL